jgi:hypothetical protein
MHVASMLRLEIWGFLALLGLTIFYRMLTRKINLAGLLSTKGNSRSTSPARVQLLLTTLVVCANYLSSVTHTTSNALPNISPQWLFALGGSGAIYAGGKALKTFKNNSRSLEPKI